MKMKLTILDRKGFSRTLDECKGNVYLIRTDGGRERINGRETAQERLWEEYTRNGRRFSLWLDVTEPGDYLRIVSYYAGDC